MAVEELNDLNMQIEIKKIDQHLQRTAPIGEGDLANVQQSQLWKQIDQNLLRFKRDSQQSYKKMLDEQIKHKKFLEKQGNMTQTEKVLNKDQLKDYKSEE